MTVAITARGACAPADRPEPITKFVFLANAAEIERQLEAYGLTGITVEIDAAEGREARSFPVPPARRASAGGGQ